MRFSLCLLVIGLVEGQAHSQGYYPYSSGGCYGGSQAYGYMAWGDPRRASFNRAPLRGSFVVPLEARRGFHFPEYYGYENGSRYDFSLYQASQPNGFPTSSWVSSYSGGFSSGGN
jgi:hypothetical protein